MNSQGTLAAPVSLAGVGLHSGRLVQVRVLPAPAGHGVRFLRVDLEHPVLIPAHLAFVVDTLLATTIGCQGQRVATVEHFLAALSMTGIDNALVEIDGPEVPALDGSALPWMAALSAVGRLAQEERRQTLVVLQEVQVRDGPRQALLRPATGLEVAITLEFEHPMLRRCSLDMTVDPQLFSAELAWARTFGFQHEVDALRAQGFARGGSLENALVFDTTGVLNPEGLRGPDEAVRHKVLDVLGDLALLGCPVRARLEAIRPGHSLHIALLRALLERPEAWTLTDEPDPRR